MFQSSPPSSEGKARAIRELSRSLSHSPLPDPTLSPPASDSNPTQHFATATGISDFMNDPDFLASTQHRIEDDTNDLPAYPRIRSTAKKVNTWQGLRSEQPVPDTSMVNKQFGDFDHSISDDDVSLEQARGGHRSNRSTPVKNSSFGPYNSLYDMTPPSGRSRKSYAAETGSLRRDAQLRRASRNDMSTTNTRPASTRNSPATVNYERKRTSLAQSHAKVSEDESSFIEERPPTVTLQAKSTRWGGPRSRQPSLQLDGMVDNASRPNATPRSRPATAQNATAQSFMLPDIPNLTELVSGVFQDGTPMFSKGTPARSRFAQPHNNGRAGGRANHYPIDSLPVPDEEKAIFTSLQLLQERVAQLEHERAEAEKRVEEQEVELIELRAASQARGGRDSALGSTDGEGSGKSNWKVDKTRLEASVQTLRTKLARVERKVELAEIEKNRRNAERDNMATRLGVASQNFEELKLEKEAMGAENDTLRDEIDRLRAENDSLREQLAQEQDHYREETIQLRRQANQADHATQRENDTLRAELTRTRAQNDENTQNLHRREAELRKARKEQADYAKLKADNDALKAQMEEIRAKREKERRQWSNQENELKNKVANRDETIRQFYDMDQEQTNEAMRLDNDNLRNELAQLTAQHDDEARRWAEKESKLRKKIQLSRQQQIGEVLTRELFDIQRTKSHRTSSSTTAKPGGMHDNVATDLNRKPSLRREDTRTRIANRVQEEMHNSKPTNASYISGRADSPRKSYIKISSNRVPFPTDVSRSVSAPLVSAAHEAYSDVESTTDLSLAPRANPYVSRRHASLQQATATIEAPMPLELTELSAFNTEDIAQLRREIEQERAGYHLRVSSAPPEKEAREDTVRSTTSTKSARRPSLPRKSSLKDVTERTAGTVFEDLTGRLSIHETVAEPTQTQESNIDASMISNTSRRRRSAPLENMTSAFILPDIKFQNRERTAKIDLTQKIETRSHDNDNCTVCRRQAENLSAESLRVPKLVPVSSRMPDDIDATLRPSRDPKEALALVVKELIDERAHLHMELAAYRVLLEAHDASLGMKKRAAINDDIQDLLRRINIKDTQIYHLYDVVEGQHGNEITEQEVEELTREIDLQTKKEEAAPVKKNKDKKVTIQSYIDSEDENSHLSGEDEELPWEGFEDTGSHSINFNSLNTGIRRKSSVVY